MKLDRQAEILKLIHEYEIDTQEELAEKLQENGYEVTKVKAFDNFPFTKHTECVCLISKKDK